LNGRHVNLGSLFTVKWHGAEPKGLKCPICGALEHQRLLNWELGCEAVIFKCGFSVTFSVHMSEGEKRQRMEEMMKRHGFISSSGETKGEL
jgi:hypothetical protein